MALSDGGNMTNQDLWRVALQQSAYDCNCQPGDFLREEPVITRSLPHPLARKYLPLPFACDLVSYGSNVVAQTSPELASVVETYLRNYAPSHCFETPSLLALEDALRPFGLRVCFMAEYFLPDLDRLKELPCPYPMRVLTQPDFSGLYTPQWSNALSNKRPQLDVLGVGAFDGNTLIGLAGCSADCANMYQIGIDVLPSYRRQGVASALTSRLALEILKRDKAPFYCAAWCNLKSVGNAWKCGFRPAWVELTAREASFVHEINGQ